MEVKRQGDLVGLPERAVAVKVLHAHLDGEQLLEIERGVHEVLRETCDNFG